MTLHRVDEPVQRCQARHASEIALRRWLEMRGGLGRPSGLRVAGRGGAIWGNGYNDEVTQEILRT